MIRKTFKKMLRWLERDLKDVTDRNYQLHSKITDLETENYWLKKENQELKEKFHDKFSRNKT